jgi:flagellum-specific ATP synthase
MAQIAEQLGTSDQGAITGFLTILVDGDDTNEPVADAARAVLDGHIVLDRRLAERGHYPAINVLASISRLALDLQDPPAREAARAAREILAECAEVEDMVRIGAYQPGMSPQVDLALRLKPVIERFLRQAPGEFETLARTRAALAGIVSQFAQQPVAAKAGTP